MNKHDSERIAGMLQQHGLSSVESFDRADVIVFMTCCVREHADERLRGQVASLKALKTNTASRNPIIAVGGCIGQRDGEKLVEQLGHIDVVFGTHNISSLFTLIDQAHQTQSRQVEVMTESDEFSADLPSAREHAYHAWLPIMVGCDNFCTYCIVPYVRGREKSRPFEEIISHVYELISDGVQEVTLLGQNVNSYGRDIYGTPRFAELLIAINETGISRIGFATSHPKDLCADTIAAMAESKHILDYLHLPFQSGSNRILELMNRKYSREQYLSIVASLRKAMPTISLSTDIMVGFPGESEQDFLETLDLVKQAEFSQAFTFIYSPRQSTPAADMTDQIPREISLERFNRLVEAVQDSAYRSNFGLTGTVQSVLVEGASKRDAAILTGKSRQCKTVHFPLPHNAKVEEFIGKEVPVKITGYKTWYLSGEFFDGD